ncbi:MAG: hypothetical protein V1816_15150 [Pseudomonadota bacterium]
MPPPVKKGAVYNDPYKLSASLTGEIIDGELHAFPRPHYRNSNIESLLNGELVPTYRHYLL